MLKSLHKFCGGRSIRDVPVLMYDADGSLNNEEVHNEFSFFLYQSNHLSFHYFNADYYLLPVTILNN